MSVDLRVDWCEHKAARFACNHWHYSRTMPVSKSAKLGVWENGVFVGAIVFALGASANLGTPYGLMGSECCELVRVALAVHLSPVSQMLSKAISLIRLQSSGLRLIVSFADTFHSHHGGIYQATNWTYTGTTSPSAMVLLSDGSLVDPRRFNGHGNRNAKWGHQPVKPIPPGAKLIRTPPKYRYLYPLDRAMRKQIAPLAKPYPKRKTREQGVEGDTVGDQPTETGSIPVVRFDATGASVS